MATRRRRSNNDGECDAHCKRETDLQEAAERGRTQGSLQIDEEIRYGRKAAEPVVDRRSSADRDTAESETQPVAEEFAYT